MSGIAGLVSMPGVAEALPLEAVRRMTVRMHARGPDAEGTWASEGVVLGHRRLAILDLDARANQPMVSSDGRYTVVFNGEIYNFRQLRRALESAGVAFHNTSDTEVLLALFAHEGERMLPRLRGMFAFTIWDAQTREPFLARDSSHSTMRTTHGLIFASQVKALLASRPVSTEREPAGWVGFFL
jgi:asparagine synthase (glutamine-hydrolysing)